LGLAGLEPEVISGVKLFLTSVASCQWSVNS
jgi:hypothetical protein